MNENKWVMNSLLRLRVPVEILKGLDYRARESMLSRSDVARRILAEGLGIIDEQVQTRRGEDDLQGADGEVA